MTEHYQWSQDRYGTEALDRLPEMRKTGKTNLALDLDAVEKAAFDGNGPAYRLMEALVSVWRDEREDGFRGAPRLLLALLTRLKEISEEGNVTGQ